MFSNNIHRNNIIFYARYVDDTFIIYKGTLRQNENFKNFMNNINKDIQFTLETETNKKLNILDLTVTKHIDKLKFNIYRKPATTDVTIPVDSQLPYSQKKKKNGSL